ncbi:MAG: IPT/TIG domain-containing protein [Solirubrobacterales bacterium]
MASALALTAASAQAAQIRIGSVLPEKFTPTEFTRVQTFFNTGLPEAGASIASPVDGAILRWQIQGASGGPFFLRVLHPNGKGAYEAAGTSLPASPTNEGLQTFSTSLKVKAGDLIGVDPTNATDKIGVAETSGASYATIFPTPFDGTVVPPSETISGKEIELSAEVLPVPEVASITPSFGSVTGGTVITITGKNFLNASAVKFGATPAASFTVDSDTEITATAPGVLRPGQVDVTVTTVAGENANTRYDDYVYRACVVPNVKGKTLPRAKSLLRQRGCKLGHVKKVEAAAKKEGKILKQNPKVGKILAPGARVRVNLGK